MTDKDRPIVADPLKEPFAPGRPGEVAACPTGLTDLGVEKLEGRQEAGRDEQDEAEEDTPT